MRLMTWNVNSVRSRKDLLQILIESYQPDILCLQELKCEEDVFPQQSLERMGFTHQAVHCQKSYNGVAILSKQPFENQDKSFFCNKDEARHISIDIKIMNRQVTLHNFYVPSGSSTASEKYLYKLNFLEEMYDFFSQSTSKNDVILLGDLNIAPYENDVWSHRQMLNVISHTEAETSRLKNIRDSIGFVDIARRYHPLHEKLFSWWSYRIKDLLKSDRGLRLDHIWLTKDLVPYVSDFRIIKEFRGRPKPSDHAPLFIDINI